MPNPLMTWAKNLCLMGIATLLILVVLEAVLRIGFDRPKGYFYFRPLDNTGLYCPSATLHMGIGPIPYTIQTNSLGFRGPEITLEKPEGVTRIAALGDSITDGFYVDNPDTYPFQLEKILRANGKNAEVVNAARGGASIDREYEILRKFVMRLSPDIVVLTFVTNDIDDLRGLTREQIINRNTVERQNAADSEFLIFARTAIGELLLDASLRMRLPKYRQFERGMSKDELADRYDIPGGDDYEANLKVFQGHMERNDSILLYNPFTEEQQKDIGNYFFALEHMRDYCAEHGAKLVLVYSPAYNQVHDPDSPSMNLHDAIRDGCAGLDVPFLDLTGPFREAVKAGPIHLAPIDFHYKPRGNRIFAQTVADFLTENQFL